MKGIKFILMGLMFVLIGGFILVDSQSNLGGYGEFALFLIGIVLGIKGLTEKEQINLDIKYVQIIQK